MAASLSRAQALASAAEQRLLGRLDAAALLTVYAVLLVAIPSDLRIPALGGAGGPPALFALLLGLLWCWTWLRGSQEHRSGARAVRTICLVLVLVTLASYVHAMSGPLSRAEINGADIGLIRMASTVAVLLLAVDGLPDADRFFTLVRRLGWIGAGLAALGLAQFLTGRALVDSISIPGLVSTQPYSAVVDRGGYVRPAGTAMSPLEYGTALSAAFPIALTYALYDQRERPVTRWLPAGLIAVALLTSGSRSALVGLAAGVLVMLPSWSRRIQLRMAALGAVSFAGLLVVTPGMVGTLRYLFFNTANDPSAQSRSGSYDLVNRFFDTSPWLGRGFGTFLPEYRILDNQYLLLLVEVGVLGLAATVVLFLVSMVGAYHARVRFPPGLHRQLGPALAASMASTALLAGFFDAFSFPMAAGSLFLIAGLCACYRGLPVDAPTDPDRILIASSASPRS